MCSTDTKKQMDPTHCNCLICLVKLQLQLTVQCKYGAESDATFKGSTRQSTISLENSLPQMQVQISGDLERLLANTPQGCDGVGDVGGFKSGYCNRSREKASNCYHLIDWKKMSSIIEINDKTENYIWVRGERSWDSRE